MKIDPNLAKSLMHVLLLAVLGALSACLVPLYTAIVTALTAHAPMLPVEAQMAITLLLPVIGAAVTKFKDELDKQLQDEENAQLVAKNMQLVATNTSLKKSLNAEPPAEPRV